MAEVSSNYKEKQTRESFLDSPNHTSEFLEILTTKEVMERLKIGRTKLFELKRKGTLIPGRHFIQNGRILRFVWGADLIETIHENPEDKRETTGERTGKSGAFERRRPGRGSIDLDY